jgi:hypothetical protein
MPASVNAQNTQSQHDAQYFDISSLYIVKSEIDASLSQVEAALSQFIMDQSVTVGLFDTADALTQVTGILRLLQMDGAVELAEAIQLLLVDIANNPDSTDDEKITGLSEGLMTLSRYLEFVLLRETLSAHLLLPITNTIRKSLKLPLLNEGHYLQSHVTADTLQTQSASLVTPSKGEAHPAAVRQHLARMFQTGLSAILRKKPAARDFTLLHKSTALMANQASSPSDALYWQTAAQVVGALSTSTMLTDSRKRVLAALERRIANPNASVDHNAVADILAMSAIAPDATSKTLNALGISHKITADQDTLAHKHFLFGPDQEVIQAVSQLIQEDIIQIKEQIDIITNGEQQADALSILSTRLKDLGQTLEALTLNYAGQGLLDQANQVVDWPQPPNEEQVHQLMIRLLDSENAMILMEQTHTPGLVMLAFTNLRISLHQLIDARNLVVTESRADIETAMASILAYLDSDQDASLMTNIGGICKTVSGAMAFLNEPRGQAILQAAAHYANDTFGTSEAPVSGKTVESKDIACLIDAIVSVNYVLEGMESKKPAGQRSYGYGEVSLAKLGYPVKQAA